MFIKNNQAFRRWYNGRNTNDPLSLREIDENNEWLDDEEPEECEDEFVFEDDT